MTDAEHVELTGDVDTLVTGSDEWAAVLDADEAAPELTHGRRRSRGPALHSGTTGRPKGAMLTHRALLANLAQLARIKPSVVAADDVVLLCCRCFMSTGSTPGSG